LADALGKQQTINIVAIGSSATEGDGASPEGSYPKRLEVALGARFPGKTIKVFNKGKGGEEAPDEAARFKTDVFPNNPSLVIWQVGPMPPGRTMSSPTSGPPFSGVSIN
jgi:hypothetical protein